MSDLANEQRGKPIGGKTSLAGDENLGSSIARSAPRQLWPVKIMVRGSSRGCCTRTLRCALTIRALRELRDLLMMHFALREKSAAHVGPSQTAAIEDHIVTRLAKSFPELGKWPPA